jgi:hypothetical protein
MRSLGLQFDVDHVAIGRDALAYVLVNTTAWMGDPDVRQSLVELRSVEEAHIVAGTATLLVKVRTNSTKELQEALRDLHNLPGASGTESIVVLETLFDRPVSWTTLAPRPPTRSLRRLNDCRREGHSWLQSSTGSGEGRSISGAFVAVRSGRRGCAR